MSYRLLILAGGNQMTLAAAKQLRALVNAGATVLGPIKPTGSPSLTDGAAGDEEVRRIADELWGKGLLPATGEHQSGAGRMLWGMTPAQALATLDTPRDFEITGGDISAKVLYAHRQTADADIYFVANHQPQGMHLTAAFRVIGRVPECWDPETGKMFEIAGWREVNGRTEVPFALEANASVFVVFRERQKLAGSLPVAETNLVAEMPVLEQLTGPWDVRFTPDWGAPAQVTFTNLISWTDFPDASVRDYSGSAIYTKEFELPALRPGERVVLDLGDVKVLAAVKLNGQDLGVAWKQPYALDVTSALHPGKNSLEVRVVNTWVNRLITDAGLPAEKRLTWTTDNPYHPGDPLLPSGLLGPVFLRDANKH